MFKSTQKLILALTLFLCSGCLFQDATRDIARASFGGPSKAMNEFTGDPVALATSKTIAILPFDNVSTEPGFDQMLFATRLSNQITSRGKVNVVYPQQVLALLKRENAKIKRHNSEVRRRRLLGTDTSTLAGKSQSDLDSYGHRDEFKKRPLLDPVRNLDDAIKIGRLLKADAVLRGRVTDFDPYLRPRISLTINLAVTGKSDTAAAALAELTQWGVPRQHSRARGVVWTYQQNFDTRDGNIGRNIKIYGATKHTEEHPFDIDVYLRSTSHFYDYVSTVLTNAMLKARKDSIVEAEQKALAQANKFNMTRTAMRNRIRNLTNPNVNLPNAENVIKNNLYDRRSRDWRPDVYNMNNPNKQAQLEKDAKAGRSAYNPGGASNK